MDDIMIDIETLSTAPNAAIMAIAAAPFEPHTGNYKYVHQWKIDLDTALQHGCADGDTVQFWMEQGPILVDGDTVCLHDALFDISDMIKERGGKSIIRPWSKGPSFDLAILRSAYKAINYELPWQYYNERCVRTVMDLADLRSDDVELPEFIEKLGGKHSPGYDVLVQVMAVSQSLQIINESSIL